MGFLKTLAWTERKKVNCPRTVVIDFDNIEYTEEEVKELIEEREHRIEDWHTRYIRRKQHHIE